MQDVQNSTAYVWLQQLRMFGEPPYCGPCLANFFQYQLFSFMMWLLSGSKLDLGCSSLAYKYLVVCRDHALVLQGLRGCSNSRAYMERPHGRKCKTWMVAGKYSRALHNVGALEIKG